MSQRCVRRKLLDMRIDIFSDIACPWCYLGEVRLKTALADAGITANIYWQPFQLQPDLPLEGVDWRLFAEKKFGGWQRALDMFEGLRELGAAEGLDYRFTDIAKANNTADAHRLVLLAEETEQGETGLGETGLGEAMATRLYRAYFSEGKDLNNEAVLLALAEDVGLDRAKTAVYLQSDKNKARVQKSQLRAAELGVSGVPFYVFNERLGVSGAQSVEVFVRALKQARAA